MLINDTFFSSQSLSTQDSSEAILKNINKKTNFLKINIKEIGISNAYNIVAHKNSLNSLNLRQFFQGFQVL